MLCVPPGEHIFRALEEVGRHFQANAAIFFAGEPQFFEPKFVVNFSGNSRLSQALLNSLGFGTVMKKGNGYPIHIITSPSVLEKQVAIVLRSDESDGIAVLDKIGESAAIAYYE